MQHNTTQHNTTQHSTAHSFAYRTKCSSAFATSVALISSNRYNCRLIYISIVDAFSLLMHIRQLLIPNRIVLVRYNYFICMQFHETYFLEIPVLNILNPSSFLPSSSSLTSIGHLNAGLILRFNGKITRWSQDMEVCQASPNVYFSSNQILPHTSCGIYTVKPLLSNSVW